MAAAPDAYGEQKPLLDNKTRSSFRGGGSLIAGYHRSGGDGSQNPLRRMGDVINDAPHGEVRSGGDEEKSEQSGYLVLRTRVALILVTIFYFLGYIPSMVIMNPYIYDRVSMKTTLPLERYSRCRNQ
ncbi:hypothetical protein ElyMa_001699400 [Elysia marginata]|uniref:Uncharacterized protein n=1 Tax=Elysia marginata TaxID=1093978 RepID=A0AAV4JU69_9GAST|nr:hypothetical protein ElyMa_001699400 [Elysia marginata]